MMQLTLHRPLPNREQRVLDILTEADGAWVCGVTLNNAGVYSYSQSIGKLKREFGYEIESTGRGDVASYRLRRA